MFKRHFPTHWEDATAITQREAAYWPGLALARVADAVKLTLYKPILPWQYHMGSVTAAQLVGETLMNTSHINTLTTRRMFGNACIILYATCPRPHTCKLMMGEKGGDGGGGVQVTFFFFVTTPHPRCLKSQSF